MSAPHERFSRPSTNKSSPTAFCYQVSPPGDALSGANDARMTRFDYNDRFSRAGRFCRGSKIASVATPI
jgi:hypothetical protein